MRYLISLIPGHDGPTRDQFSPFHDKIFALLSVDIVRVYKLGLKWQAVTRGFQHAPSQRFSYLAKSTDKLNQFRRPATSRPGRRKIAGKECGFSSGANSQSTSPLVLINDPYQHVYRCVLVGYFDS